MSRYEKIGTSVHKPYKLKHVASGANRREEGTCTVPGCPIVC